MGINLNVLLLGNDFLAVTPKSQVTKGKNKYAGHHQNPKLICIKGHYQEVKKQSTEWENIF